MSNNYSLFNKNDLKERWIDKTTEKKKFGTFLNMNYLFFF